METTNIRLNGVYPDQEFRTVPLLPSRVVEGGKNLVKGQKSWMPELYVKGHESKVGDTVVIIATNQGRLRQRETV